MSNDSIETVVISLTTAAERRAGMSSMLQASLLSWSYFDAHRGLEAPGLHYDIERTRVRFGRGLGRQELAVYSSHYAVIEHFAASSTAEFLFVLEDDVMLDTSFPFAEFARHCASLGMDYVRLFGKHHADAVNLGYFYDRNLIRYRTTPAGAQAYLLTKRGAKVLVEGLRDVTGTPDRVMDRFWALNLPIYGITPFPAIERFSPTQIPMPTRGELTAAQSAQWIGFRLSEKARKIAANVVLHASDARIRRTAGHFRQIDAEIASSVGAAARSP